jgi:large subunit ribosomal protein L10
VKNSLTERAADKAGADTLKLLLEGPTALTFVHGDAALAAKAIADYARTTDLLPFKGGLLDGEALEPDQIRAIARLPARDVLYGQLVGVVASPVTGLVRTLNALIQGLALQLGQIAEQGLVAGEAPPEPEAAAEAPPDAEADSPDAEAPAPQTDSAAADAEAEQAQPDSAPAKDDTNADAPSSSDGGAEEKE